jgi:hypothetical protein
MVEDQLDDKQLQRRNDRGTSKYKLENLQNRVRSHSTQSGEPRSGQERQIWQRSEERVAVKHSRGVSEEEKKQSCIEKSP